MWAPAVCMSVCVRVCPGCSPLAQLLQGPTSAQAQVIAQKLQLLPEPPDNVHLLHVLVQRGVHQLQIDEGLDPDLRQELQGLPADLEPTRQWGWDRLTTGGVPLGQAQSYLLTPWPHPLQGDHLHLTDERTEAWG